MPQADDSSAIKQTSEVGKGPDLSSVVEDELQPNFSSNNLDAPATSEAAMPDLSKVVDQSADTAQVSNVDLTNTEQPDLCQVKLAEDETLPDEQQATLDALNNPEQKGGKATSDAPESNDSKALTEADIDELISKERQHYILYGDGDEGGAHKHGVGEPRKSEFPEDWSDNKIFNAAIEIATDKDVQLSERGRNGFVAGQKLIDGVETRVVFNPETGYIHTAYPVNLPRNP